MRILFLNFKKFWGGGEKMTLTLAQGALARGHEVYFLVHPGAPLLERLQSIGIPVDGVSYRNPLKLFSTYWKRGPFDVIATQSDQEIRYAYYLALFSDTPIVTRLGVSDRYSVNFLQKLLHGMTVQVNFTNYQLGLQMLAEVYGKKLHRPVLLPNGVQTPPCESHNPRLDLGLPQDALVVGMVGRLEERKGCRLLLSAFQSLAPRFANLHLILAGDGGLFDEMQRQAGECIHVLGFMESIGDVLRCLDILALPVLWGEGTSNAVLEAMSLGCPVVASNDGGMKDIVQDGATGLLVQKGSQQALESALARLIKDEDLRRRLGKAGQAWVQEHRSIEQMVETFLHWTDCAINS
jgi:glycosyltransferase involved in cell wall biosynthesis